MVNSCKPENGSEESIAQALNEACLCRTLNRDALRAALHSELAADALGAAHSTMFSNVAVFISAAEFAAMHAVVRAITDLAREPAYVEAALAWAPPIARHDYGPSGLLMGYDFHLGADGPSLIEVNTNAGGAFLSALLARAQRVCCAEAQAALAPAERFEDAFLAMVLAEWRAQGRAGQPSSLVIVDDDPPAQYLYPEFLVARHMLERSGIGVEIADAQSLALHDNRLVANGRAVDFVYNRLVDFPLAEERHAVLREAYVRDLAVFSPNPRAHALLADKRNLTLWSDATLLRSWGVSEQAVTALKAVPETVLVTPSNADTLWRERKAWFFKPAQGYASKATYRGEKLTLRTWKEIVGVPYVAQAFRPPSERTVSFDDVVQKRKIDVRLYVYRTDVVLAAARLYQGQTTNFRTPGGGFAPVFVV